MLSGNNGILQKATDAKTESGKGQEQEIVALAYNSALAKKMGNGDSTPVTSEDMNTELTNQEAIASGSNPITVIFEESNRQYTINSKGIIDFAGTNNKIQIASTNETKPWLPTGAEIINNDLSTGLTIKDENENEWVWIEVPKSITASTTNDAEIKSALENYIYVQNAKNTNGTAASVPLLTKTNGAESNKNYNKTTVGYTDTWYDGCGLSSGEYATKYSAMLNSIKENGGFYIGKYETGYELPEGSTNFRSDSNKSSTSEHVAVIKQGAYPYNYVTCSQAEDLAEGFAMDEKNTTLMFGIQWDLVLKYLNNQGVSIAELTEDSSSWENFSNTTNASLTSGKYTQYMNSSYQNTFNNWISCDMDLGEYIQGKTLLKNDGMPHGILLTTGISSKFNKKNIYDLVGNMDEYTLEQTTYSGRPCNGRGGSFMTSGSGFPASARDISSPTTGVEIMASCGFRVSLY